MERLMSLRGCALSLSGFAFALLAPVSMARGSPTSAVTPPEIGPVSVTARDVTASNEKARMAFGALVSMWTSAFEQVGAQFARPGLARYRDAVQTSCGVMGPGNAAYCPRENVIYFDELFLAAQAKRAARELGTDGDMAAVGVIAHEMGHAVAMQLGRASRFNYENESSADCLAGAFARRAGDDGSLEAGDVEEAFYAMYTAGDPPPELTGDRRLDRRIVARAALMGHGTYDQRMQNFRTGLEGGPRACLPELAGVS